MSERATKARGADFSFSRVAEATTFFEPLQILFSVMRKLATHDIYCVRTLCSSELSSEHASPGGGAADLPSLSGSHIRVRVTKKARATGAVARQPPA